MKITTLCYIEKDEKYLMLLRNAKENDPNHGKWIGVGGKLEEDESAEQCAVREIREETGLTALEVVPRGVVIFNSDVWETEYMFLFSVTEFEGTLTECDEGELHWIDKRDVMNLNIWDGDRIFLSLLMCDIPFFEVNLTYQGERLRKCIVNDVDMELFDIYNEDGSPANYVVERNYAHLMGLWHSTVHI